MTVYKRGKVFYMDFVVKGLRVFKSTGKQTKREAVIAEASERKRLSEEASLSPREKAGKLKLSQAMQLTYDERWKNNKDGNKALALGNKLVGLIGDIPIAKIDDEVVKDLVKNLEKTEIQPGTINRYLATLKTALRHHRQPWDHVKLKKERKGRIRTISREEEAKAVKLLRETEHPPGRGYYRDVADLVEVLVDTGMRLSEALNLRYDDISFDANLISIWINKGDRPRSIPMTTRVAAIMETRKKDGVERPLPLSVHMAERAWKWVRKEMGLDAEGEFVLHALRHSCASRLVNRGVDLYVIKEWLGHSSIQVTEKYAHLAPSKLAGAALVLEDPRETLLGGDI